MGDVASSPEYWCYEVSSRSCMICPEAPGAVTVHAGECGCESPSEWAGLPVCSEADLVTPDMGSAEEYCLERERACTLCRDEDASSFRDFTLYDGSCACPF